VERKGPPQFEDISFTLSGDMRIDLILEKYWLTVYEVYSLSIFSCPGTGMRESVWRQVS
jgi:hypothetical protein